MEWLKNEASLRGIRTALMGSKWFCLHSCKSFVIIDLTGHISTRSLRVKGWSCQVPLFLFLYLIIDFIESDIRRGSLYLQHQSVCTLLGLCLCQDHSHISMLRTGVRVLLSHGKLVSCRAGPCGLAFLMLFPYQTQGMYSVCPKAVEAPGHVCTCTEYALCVSKCCRTPRPSICFLFHKQLKVHSLSTNFQPF